MPCRKEKYILLEQSVTVDSKEVDALVTKIGEALQLHNNAGANQKTMSCLHSHNSNGSSNVKQTNNNGAALHRRNGCCIRLRNRGLRSRASPYNIPGSSDQEWDRFKSWNRKTGDVSTDEDDPHQLLQELILSGNLIKEAVRRLQFSASERTDHSNSADNLQC
ncbi:glycogen synthase kinase binding protein [Megalops cyprinoides]|uniref:glycogen synthase kinase binding protein n=1 Tax=Megalops cyprinoides TaxID=118141 RepID=UPI0018649D12|nr:glycogen synthase kinase binding protein [Megalops cyprinoides]